uniref:Uncharacterized protein n=1 Tax=Timema bartmani TaxID=61472 RepID=A0A7R9F440_9NEOP|nr:unnamed protein product [Timema bartmani]
MQRPSLYLHPLMKYQTPLNCYSVILSLDELRVMNQSFIPIWNGHAQIPQPTSLPVTFVKEHRKTPTKSSMVLATDRSDDNILVNNVHQSASKTVKQNNALNVDQSESIDVGVSGQGALSSKRDVALKDDKRLPNFGKKGKILQTDCRTNPSAESTTDEHIGEDGQRFTRTDSRRRRILNNILSSSDEDELVDIDTQDCTMLQSQRKPKNKISVSPAKDHKASQSLQKGWKRSRTKIDEFSSKKSQSTRVEKLPKADIRLQTDVSHQANMTVGNHGRLSLSHRPSLLVGMFGLSNASSAGRKLDKSHEKKTGVEKVEYRGSKPAFAWKKVENQLGKPTPSSPKQDLNLDLPVLRSLAQHKTSALTNYTTEAVAYKLNKTYITPQRKSTKRGRSNFQKDIDCLSEDDAKSEKENDWGPIMPITKMPLSDVSSGDSTTPLANYYNIIDGSLNSLHSAHSSPGMPMFHSNKEATHLINKHVKDKEKASKRSRPIDNTTKVTKDNPKPWSEMKKAVKKLSHLKPVDDDSNLSDASTCIYTSLKYIVDSEDSLALSDKTIARIVPSGRHSEPADVNSATYSCVSSNLVSLSLTTHPTGGPQQLTYHHRTMHHLPVGVVPNTRDSTATTVAKTYQATTSVVYTTSTTTFSVSTGCVVTASVGATSTTDYVLPPSTQASLDLGTNSYRCLHVPIEDWLVAIRERAQAAADALGIDPALSHGPLGPPNPRGSEASSRPPLPPRTTRPAKVASSSERRRQASSRSAEAMEASSDSTETSTTGTRRSNRTAAGKWKDRDVERRSPPKKSAPRSGRSSSRINDLRGASSGSGMGKSASSVPTSRAVPLAVALPQVPRGKKAVTGRDPRGAQAVAGATPRGTRVPVTGDPKGSGAIPKDPRPDGKTNANPEKSGTQRVPVIVCEGDLRVNPFTATKALSRGLGGDLRIKWSSNRVTFSVFTLEDRATLLERLISQGYQPYTYPLDSERDGRLVVRGLPLWTPAEDIHSELTEMGYAVRSVTHLGVRAAGQDQP